MIHGNEFGESWTTPATDPELIAQAERVAEMATAFLEAPDWEQTQVHFQTPLGASHRLELLDRVSGASLDPNLHPNIRQIEVIQNATEGNFRVAPLTLDLKELAESKRVEGLYHPEAVTALLQAVEHAGTTDTRVVQLVKAAVHLRRAAADEEIIKEMTTRFNMLLAQGTINDRCGIKHTLADGTQVFLMSSSREGDQPWPEIDAEPLLHLRVVNGVRAVDFKQKRDGTYQSHHTSPNSANEARSIVGDDKVFKLGETAIVVDLGDNAAKYAAVEEAESMLGMRTLRAEHVHLAEEALKALANERGQ